MQRCPLTHLLASFTISQKQNRWQPSQLDAPLITSIVLQPAYQPHKSVSRGKTKPLCQSHFTAASSTVWFSRAASQQSTLDALEPTVQLSHSQLPSCLTLPDRPVAMHYQGQLYHVGAFICTQIQREGCFLGSPQHILWNSEYYIKTVK